MKRIKPIPGIEKTYIFARWDTGVSQGSIILKRDPRLPLGTIYNRLSREFADEVEITEFRKLDG